MTVETDIGKRREQWIKHDPRSEELVEAIKDLDLKYGGDFFQLRGKKEHLMYLLDIYYELQEEGQKKRYSEQIKSWIDRTRDLDTDKEYYDPVGAHICPHCKQATLSDPCEHCSKRSSLP